MLLQLLVLTCTICNCCFIIRLMHQYSSKLGFLKKALGPHEKSKDGINYAFRCPSCASDGSNKKKLVIKVDTGIYQCWVCDLKGKTLDYLFKKFRPSFLQEYLGVFSRKSLSLSPEERLDNEIQQVQLPKGFKVLAANLKAVDPDLCAVKRYATSRYLTHPDLWYFKIGTCLQGRYRRRLIIPSFDAEGVLNYYVARAIDKSQTMKYLNAKIPKKDIIFNEINLDWKQELTLVEGPFDLMKCNQNATCILGSNLNEKYLLFKKIVENKTPVLLALDPDATKKMHDIARLLSSYGINVRIASVSNTIYEDVGSMSKEEFLSLKGSAHEWSGKDRLIHMINGIKSGSII
jgi:hypothetical protein